MKKTVMIVDDNMPTRRLMAGILEKEGFETRLLPDGQSALKMARDAKIDCALIDQYMIPMDGLTLSRSLTVAGFKFPKALITANETNDLLIQAQKNGFVTVMLKPIDPERLVELVRRMCR